METYRVLVTGCSGFLGRYVVEELHKAGHEVVGFDLVKPTYSIADYRRGDLTARHDLNEVLPGVNAVCHLGGVGDVYLADKDPALAFRVNAFGTKELCDACKDHRVDELIYASTWEVYGKPLTNPIDETHPCNPESPYSISKLAGELFVRRSGLATKLRTVSLRLGTACGSLMGESAVIARFITRARSRKPLQIQGDGKQFRQFTHAEGIARGFALALRVPLPGLVYNLISDERVAIGDLAQMIAKRFGVPIEFQPARQAEPPSALVSSERARSDLHWDSRILFANGLENLLRSADANATGSFNPRGSKPE